MKIFKLRFSDSDEEDDVDQENVQLQWQQLSVKYLPSWESPRKCLLTSQATSHLHFAVILSSSTV